MGVFATQTWAKLEHWSPRLFVLAAVFLLVGAANSGLAFVIEGYAFDGGWAVVLELGRLAALLGTAGLTARVVDRNARLGTLLRAVASLAVLFVTGLIVLATLSVLGVLGRPPAIVGLPAYVLSVSAFLATGVVVLGTGAFSRRVGGLLVANVLALLAVFFGRAFVPLGLVATVVPSIQVLLYLGIGYGLHGQGVATRQSSPAMNTTP